MHSCHNAHGDNELPVPPGPYPIIEDPSTCDIVTATQYVLVLCVCETLKQMGVSSSVSQVSYSYQGKQFHFLRVVKEEESLKATIVNIFIINDFISTGFVR